MFVYRVNLLYMAPNQRKTFQGTFSVDPGTFLPDNRLQDGNSFSYWRPPAGRPGIVDFRFTVQNVDFTRNAVQNATGGVLFDQNRFAIGVNAAPNQTPANANPATISMVTNQNNVLTLFMAPGLPSVWTMTSGATAINGAFNITLNP